MAGTGLGGETWLLQEATTTPRAPRLVMFRHRDTFEMHK